MSSNIHTRPFSYNEIKSRIDRIRMEMERQGIDCIVAQSSHNFYYITGSPVFPFGRPCAVILPLNGEPTIIQAVLELEHTRAQSYIADIRTYWDLEKPPLESLYLLMKKVLEEKNLSRSCIGFEDESIPYYFYKWFEKTFPEAKFVGISALLDIIRMIKSDEELKYIRIASEIADLGMERFLEIVEPSKLVYEISKECREVMELEIMRKYPEVPYIVWCEGITERSENERISKSAPHTPWALSDLHTKVGEGVGICISDVHVWGYWSNVERTFIVGKHEPEVKKHFQVMVEMHNAALDVMKPGNRIPDVEWAAKAVLIKHGYSRFNYGSGCERGIVHYGTDQTGGRNLRADLRIYNDFEFKPNMVFSVEPELRVPGVGTFRHCSTVVITQRGHEVLSKIPWDIILIR